MYLLMTKGVFPLNNTFSLCKRTVASRISNFPALHLWDQVHSFLSGFCLFSHHLLSWCSREVLLSWSVTARHHPGAGVWLCSLPMANKGQLCQRPFFSKGPAARREVGRWKKGLSPFHSVKSSPVQVTLKCFSMNPCLVKEHFCAEAVLKRKATSHRAALVPLWWRHDKTWGIFFSGWSFYPFIFSLSLFVCVCVCYFVCFVLLIVGLFLLFVLVFFFF